MKKWFICKSKSGGNPLPHDCTPIGITYQKMQGDVARSNGFVCITDFESWLVKHKYQAYAEGYSHLLKGQAALDKLPVLYPD